MAAGFRAIRSDSTGSFGESFSPYSGDPIMERLVPRSPARRKVVDKGLIEKGRDAFGKSDVTIFEMVEYDTSPGSARKMELNQRRIFTIDGIRLIASHDKYKHGTSIFIANSVEEAINILLGKRRDLTEELRLWSVIFPIGTHFSHAISLKRRDDRIEVLCMDSMGHYEHRDDEKRTLATHLFPPLVEQAARVYAAYESRQRSGRVCSVIGLQECSDIELICKDRAEVADGWDVLLEGYLGESTPPEEKGKEYNGVIFTKIPPGWSRATQIVRGNGDSPTAERIGIDAFIERHKIDVTARKLFIAVDSEDEEVEIGREEKRIEFLSYAAELSERFERLIAGYFEIEPGEEVGEEQRRAVIEHFFERKGKGY